MPRLIFALSGLALLAGCVAPPPPPGPVVAVQPPRVYEEAPPPVGYAGPVRNPMVRDIQRQLRRHGYYPGPVDGAQTPQTADAIRGFQARHGMTPDGVPSPYLLRALRQIPPGA